MYSEGTCRKGEMPYRCDVRFPAVGRTNSTEEAAEQTGSQPCAEVVEERSLTKGNTMKNATDRTQSREPVSDGLNRVRQKAHNGKEVGMWLRKVIIGYQNYYAVPTNLKNVKRFRDCIVKAWIKVLRRRSHKARNLRWEIFARRTDELLPRVKQVHPFPGVRFYAIHPR